MRKRILIVLLCFIGVSLFCSVRNTLLFKFPYGITQMRNLYKQKRNSIDVLILGSSHVFFDINTQPLFDDYGIAAYDLAGEGAPFWNSYFYLKEALKTQKPKLVVFEGFISSREWLVYHHHQGIIKNFFGLKESFLKYESLWPSSPKKNRDDYIFGYRLYSARYKDLNETDRKEFYQKGRLRESKGYIPIFITNKAVRPSLSVTETKETLPMNEKMEKWFERIVKLCEQHNIPLMVVVTPFAVKEDEQKRFNYLEKLSKKHSLKFINYNRPEMYDAIGLDFSKDFLDYAHFNYRGALKFSKFFGKDIKDNYSLPDRRGNKEYASWEINNTVLKNSFANLNIADAKDADDFIQKLSENKEIKLYINTISSTREIAESGFFKKLNVDGNTLKDGRLYGFDNGALTELSGNKINWRHVAKLFDKKAIFRQEKNYSDKLSAVNSLVWNGKEYIDDKNGAYIVAYDTVSREVAAIVQIIFKKENGKRSVELVKKFSLPPPVI
ncbi:MAG: hypothetical protein J5716_05155 [Alphaproteobacteria bacterium]|nr:hypothetical protein [Alphaproteobacteria bacterium]